MEKFLITGVAGFIGSYLAKKILMTKSNANIIGIDNLNDYYDVKLKETRLQQLTCFPNFVFIKEDITNKISLHRIFEEYQPDIVVNLAAQAGVRYSIDNPDVYINSNIFGFYNILEACRHSYDVIGRKNYEGVQHLIYASSSSVYGFNEKIPYSESDRTDNPVSLYAATKKSNELMAYSYSKLYKIPMTGLRFFTVYGPLGRPDMAYFKFTDQLVRGEKIELYNYGNMWRDFTYIDDIIEGIMKVIESSPQRNVQEVYHSIYNIGNSKPESILHFVEIIEKCLIEEKVIKTTVGKELKPMQLGDVYQTYADISLLKRNFGFNPSVSIEQGLSRFVKWYKEYYIKTQDNML